MPPDTRGHGPKSFAAYAVAACRLPALIRPVPKIRVTSAVIKCRNWSPTGPGGKVAQPADHGSQRVDTADGDVQTLIAGRGQRERSEQPEHTETDVNDVVVRVDQEDPEKLVIGHIGDLG